LNSSKPKAEPQKKKEKGFRVKRKKAPAAPIPPRHKPINIMTDQEISETIPHPYRDTFIATVEASKSTWHRRMSLLDSPVRELTQDGMDVLATMLMASACLKFRVSPCLKHLFVQDYGQNFQSYDASIPLGEFVNDVRQLIEEWTAPEE
jgi:hypothetical protein